VTLASPAVSTASSGAPASPKRQGQQAHHVKEISIHQPPGSGHLSPSRRNKAEAAARGPSPSKASSEPAALLALSRAPTSPKRERLPQQAKEMSYAPPCAQPTGSRHLILSDRNKAEIAEDGNTTMPSTFHLESFSQDRPDTGAPAATSIFGAFNTPKMLLDQTPEVQTLTVSRHSPLSLCALQEPPLSPGSKRQNMKSWKSDASTCSTTIGSSSCAIGESLVNPLGSPLCASQVSASIVRLCDFLRSHRGTVIRAWRHDFDRLGVGRVSHADFAKACRRLGFADAGGLWAALRPDGSSAALQLRDLDAREAHNLELFAALLWSIPACGNFEKAWALFDTSKRSYVTLSEFVHAGRSLGAQCDLRLLFKGLDLHGQGHLTRENFEYVRVLAPLFQPMVRLAPSITELSAWVHNDLGGPRAFIDCLGLELGKNSTLSLCDLADRLERLGFVGDAQEAARSVARCGGAAGYHISAEQLMNLLSGHRTFSQTIPPPPRNTSDGTAKRGAEMEKEETALRNGWNDSITVHPNHRKYGSRCP